MSDIENVRRALDGLVGHPPINLGRRGAVMSRISAVHHRRRIAAQAAFSAFVILSAGLGASRVISARPAGNDRLVVEAPKPTKSAKPDPKPSAKPTTAAPKPKPVVSATAKPQPVAEPTTKPKPVYEPKPSYEPKPEPTKVYADGLSAELWPYTTATANAEMQWKVKAYDGAGRLLRIELLFGDGTKVVYEPESACGEGTSVKQFFPHVYKAAGTYYAKATVTTGGCGAATETKVVTSSVKVTSAAAPADDNGPAQPTVSASQVAAELTKLLLHGADSDGWVKKFYVDWGDGNESIAGPRSFDGCQNLKPSSWDTYATHTYASPGTYTVKVTVLSTSCSASDGQTATYTLSVTV